MMNKKNTSVQFFMIFFVLYYYCPSWQFRGNLTRDFLGGYFLVQGFFLGNVGRLRDFFGS